LLVVVVVALVVIVVGCRSRCRSRSRRRSRSRVFKIKGAWPITRAEKLQVSVFLPNDLSLDDWYAGVCALPTVWPDVSMMGASNLRRVVGYDFHHIRKKYDVPSMWGNIHPQWRLLQQHLETKGPGWYPLAEREERLLPTDLIGLEMI